MPPHYERTNKSREYELFRQYLRKYTEHPFGLPRATLSKELGLGTSGLYVTRIVDGFPVTLTRLDRATAYVTDDAFAPKIEIAKTDSLKLRDDLRLLRQSHQSQRGEEMEGPQASLEEPSLRTSSAEEGSVEAAAVAGNLVDQSKQEGKQPEHSGTFHGHGIEHVQAEGNSTVSSIDADGAQVRLPRNCQGRLYLHEYPGDSRRATIQRLPISTETEVVLNFLAAKDLDSHPKIPLENMTGYDVTDDGFIFVNALQSEDTPGNQQRVDAVENKEVYGIVSEQLRPRKKARAGIFPPGDSDRLHAGAHLFYPDPVKEELLQSTAMPASTLPQGPEHPPTFERDSTVMLLGKQYVMIDKNIKIQDNITPESVNDFYDTTTYPTSDKFPRGAIGDMSAYVKWDGEQFLFRHKHTGEFHAPTPWQPLRPAPEEDLPANAREILERASPPGHAQQAEGLDLSR